MAEKALAKCSFNLFDYTFCQEMALLVHRILIQKHIKYLRGRQRKQKLKTLIMKKTGSLIRPLHILLLEYE